MSSMDDKSLPAVPGKSLIPFKNDDQANEAKAPEAPAAEAQAPSAGLLRWAIPVAAIALTGGLGWYAGAHTAGAGGQRLQVERSIASEMKAQSAALAALEARLKGIESAPGAEAALKPAIDILAQRIDEIARRQTAALTQTSNRLDRSDKDMAARLDKINDRMERIEKQVSSATPVGSVQKNVTAVTRTGPDAPASAPPAAAKAEEPEEKAVRGYVLRDVFRGGALVESRYGLMEVFPGVQLPGAGRVRSVEKRDGRWVVVTTAGVIASRAN